MSSMVACLSRQFAVLHNALKFDALYMLATLLSSRNNLFHEALLDLVMENWAAYIRVGVMEILQNRIVCGKKLQALLLVDSIMYMFGESWLLEDKELDDVRATLPVHKFLLLVLESARVEVAVFLNELAFLKYESSKSSSTTESIISKQHNLGLLFSLMEKIIKLISSSCTVDGTLISEEVAAQMISGINETIILVLDFLQDAKDHCCNKGDDLLAAVRIVGSYLAENPFACKEKVRDLLQYMLSVEGEDESSPFYSICFLLPMLCQITMEVDGRQSLASFGGHECVIECLVKLLRESRTSVEHSGIIFLACDTILNILLNRKELEGQIEGSQFVRLLQELCFWAESSSDPSVIMMAATICSVVFDLTSEENLLNHPEFHHGALESLTQLIVRSLSTGLVDDDANGHHDLHVIVRAGYNQWAHWYPFVKDAVERSRNG
ncbi:hypothetical protein AXF42_Ash020193 [Apostasia shenzhenica]|uniref:Neurochondrin n=1 Tax=Apostasia shenzhenica TaxID=1088818 RepID=A0A2H9ZW14_9ASPA|nr:hypothetical protein AXF42_Ash020193 [Apostasia shenzhenica]